MADPKLKVVVIGDSGVGKTSMLITFYWSGKFPSVYIPSTFERVVYRMVDDQAMLLWLLDQKGKVNLYGLTMTMLTIIG